MRKFEAQSEAPNTQSDHSGDAHPFASTIADTYGPGARAHQSGRTDLQGIPKDFVETNKESQRQYMGVETGRNPETGEPNGKPMASSETLLRAESKMVYSAINAKHDPLKSEALDRLGVDATGKVTDPTDNTKSVNLKDPEAVYQRYLQVEAKRENVDSTSPRDIENARLRELYKNRKNIPETKD